MEEIFILQKSSNPKKKYSVKFLSNKNRIKTINFGQKGYSDFLIHGDLDRLNRYVKRHSKMGENWNDPTSGAGFWSKHILWNPNAHTIREAVRQIENSFNIKIILNNL
jgi:hypothetical protein